MIRVVRLTCLWMACFAVAASSARAQSASPTGDQSRYSAEFVGAATIGHKSSGSIGGEFDYRLSASFDVFFEVGHMFNVKTSDIQTRADRVAAFIGGSSTVKQRVDYFNLGIKYRFPVFGSGFFTTWAPYAGIGAGVGRVGNRARFAVNGVDVTDQIDQYGVDLTRDLSGTIGKGTLLINLGAQRAIAQKYFVDVSYRYTRVYARQGAILDDVAINTNRIQGGFGRRF